MSGDVCEWVEDRYDGVWDTSCQHRFEFTVDGPRENEFTFCPYCGARLESICAEDQ